MPLFSCCDHADTKSIIYIPYPRMQTSENYSAVLVEKIQVVGSEFVRGSTQAVKILSSYPDVLQTTLSVLPGEIQGMDFEDLCGLVTSKKLSAFFFSGGGGQDTKKKAIVADAADRRLAHLIKNFKAHQKGKLPLPELAFAALAGSCLGSRHHPAFAKDGGAFEAFGLRGATEALNERDEALVAELEGPGGRLSLSELLRAVKGADLELTRRVGEAFPVAWWADQGAGALAPRLRTVLAGRTTQELDTLSCVQVAASFFNFLNKYLTITLHVEMFQLLPAAMSNRFSRAPGGASS